MSHWRSPGIVAAICLALAAASFGSAEETPARIKVDPQETQVQFLIDGREALAWRFGDDVDLPHFFPIHSPSGKLLTVQQTEPYPHHRSLWFADTVQLAGQRQASFYNAYYTRNAKDKGFRDRIRHIELTPQKSEKDSIEVVLKLLWEMEGNVPVLDERRQMRIVALEKGDYFIDLEFTLIASHGDVRFMSDAVHYAWPYVRIHPQFSVEKGGTLTNSAGGESQAGTNDRAATWVDYSNTIDGATEGLALFSHPQNGQPPRWLTRDYGTFGPRRPEEQSGKPFVLEKGQTLRQRVGILVHRGDVKEGQVAERYERYAAGKL